MAIRAGGPGQTGQASQSGRPGTDEVGRPGTDEVGRPGTGETARPGAGQADSPEADEIQWRRPGRVMTAALGVRDVPGTGSATRWFFAGIWLIYLVQPVSDLFGHHHGALWIAGGLAITVAFAAIYITIVCNAGSWPRQALWGLVVIAVLAALACVVYGKAWTPLWIYVSAAAGMILAAPQYGRRVAVRGVLAVGACYVFFSWLSHEDATTFLIVLLPVLLVGFAMIGFRLQIQLTHELAEARETVAKLAANEERLRLARDMHDLTGQSLSTITLKSELASKRLSKLPASAERDAVIGDLGDIGRVSRQTLHDIREAVSGYRRPTLAIEVITARNALEAAGIQLDDDPGLTLRSGTFDADAEAALAWCLREAVTNVIRHSGARSCRIRLTSRAGELSLEVADDGRGLGRQDPDETRGTGLGDLAGGEDAQAAETPRGTGLGGMSERLSAVGGHLSLGPADPGRGRGFRLIATVPVDRYDP
jgi:two-component system, NarL family, sensor histidine kinase DesK